MLNPKVRDLINTQINKEFYSAYLYLTSQIIFMMRGLMALRTGMTFRRRKSAIMRC